MDSTSSNNIECNLYHPDVASVFSTVETSTFDIEIPGTVKKNIEVTTPVVCPEEEETLSPEHSTELMTTEAISFVETNTNAPVETSTYVIETPGPEMENVEVAPPAVVSPMKEQTLPPGEENEKQTTLIDTGKTVPLRKKKSRFLSALRRGFRRVFKTICGCGCSMASSNHPDEDLYRDEFAHEIEKFNDRWSV